MAPHTRGRASARARRAPVDPVFRALADATRRDILSHLAAGELTVNDVASRFAISRPAISKHLHVLKRAGLVRERKDGRARYYALDHGPLQDLFGWFAALDAFWAERMGALGRHLDAGSEARRNP